jgi:segregation and condensation protein A
MSEQGDYRVNLDIYNGPLDLLLYLIKRDELDIHDIPIARITQQYLAYVEMLKQLDPNLAGEFLVMAAALVEIKSRMLLPAREAQEGESEDLALDPREELVRQLLEYKAFKDAAHDLSDAADIQSQRFPRRPAGFEPDTEKDTELEDLQIWDLFDAFRNVLDAIGQMSAHHEVIVDDTPQELYREDLLDRIRRDGALPFSRIFEGRSTRGEIIGLFLALLELCKLRKLRAYQPESFSEIQVDLREEQDDDNLDNEDFSDDDNEDAASVSDGRHDRPEDDETLDYTEAFEPPTGEDVKSKHYVREIEDDEDEPEDILAADRQARDELDAILEIDIDERLAEYQAAREALHAARKQRENAGDDEADAEFDKAEDEEDFDDQDYDDEDDDEDFDGDDEDDDASSFSGGRNDRPEDENEDDDEYA